MSSSRRALRTPTRRPPAPAARRRCTARAAATRRPAGLVHAVPDQHDVRRTRCLILSMVRLPGCVRLVERLRDDAVEAGALELAEPAAGDLGILCRLRRGGGAAGLREHAPSAARRSENGASSSDVAVAASRSKPTNDAGVSTASLSHAALRRGGCAGRAIPVEALAARLAGLRTTISPSTTVPWGSWRANAATSSGKYRVSGFDPRLPISTPPVGRDRDDRAEPVPLRLERQPALDLVARAPRRRASRASARGSDRRARPSRTRLAARRDSVQATTGHGTPTQCASPSRRRNR